MLLHITVEHKFAVGRQLPCDGKRATIYYSRAFNILKPEDRSELMKFMFWLACVQKESLHKFVYREWIDICRIYIIGFYMSSFAMLQYLFYPRITCCGGYIMSNAAVGPCVRASVCPCEDFVNTIETKPLCASFSNLADMLTKMRGWTLLILKVGGQRSRSQLTHIWK